MSDVITILVWYTRESWRHAKSISDDDMDESYDVWLESALRLERKVRSSGARPVRLTLDVDDFMLWCRANQMPMNSSSRSSYAALKGPK